MHAGLIGSFELAVVMTVSVCLFVGKCQPCGKLVYLFSVTEKRKQAATMLVSFTVWKEYVITSHSKAQHL